MGNLHEHIYTLIVISRGISSQNKKVFGIVVQKIKTHILRSRTFLQKPCRLWDKVGKNRGTGQATDNDITERIRFTFWTTKATDTQKKTHSEYVIPLVLDGNNGYANALQYYVYMYISCLVCSDYK